MKRPKTKKRNDLQFAVRFGDSSIKLRFQKPDKQTTTRLLKWIVALVLAVVILWAPQLWEAIQRALAVMHW